MFVNKEKWGQFLSAVARVLIAGSHLIKRKYNFIYALLGPVSVETLPKSVFLCIE